MSYLTKKDLVERIYGIERYRPGDRSTQAIHLAVSSGTTTGSPTIVALYRPDRPGGEVHETWIGNLGRHLRLPLNRLGGLQVVRRALAANAIECFMALDESDLEERNLEIILREYRPQSMRGSTSGILRFAERLEGVDAHVRENMRLIQLLAELSTPIKRKRIQSIFPQATLQSGYMLSEVVYPTIECPAVAEHYHLLKDADTVLSIADPNEEGIGEIIATTPELTNYRTGDLGRIDHNPCPCGKSPILELHGRKDYDIVPVLGALFLKAELERALEPIAALLLDYQLRVGEVLQRGIPIGKAVFDFVPATITVREKDIANHVARTLYVTKTRTLQQLIDERIFLPLTAQRMTTIARGKKKVELRRDPSI